MKIGGFLKQSLIDYPGKIASVIFTSGCNFRCIYCHNPELVLPDLIDENLIIQNNVVLEYIEKNKNLLDAVVITGGEPTIHGELPDFIQQIKQLGLSVKLDTNGTNPKMLNNLLKKDLIDFVAMDIKAPMGVKKHQNVVGEQFTFTQLDRVLESIHIIKKSNIKFEFRSTLIKPYHSEKDINEMTIPLSGDYYLQKFNESKILNPAIKNLQAFNQDEIQKEIVPCANGNVNIKFR